VENDEASTEPEERGGAIDLEEGADAPGTCDGRECYVRDFHSKAVGPLKRAIEASEHPEQWKQYGKGGQFDGQLAVYAKRVCAAAKRTFAEFTRPRRDEMCERALVAAVESLKGAKDVQAVIASRIKQPADLNLLCGDRVVEELRRTKRDRRRKSEPTPVGECIRAGTVCPPKSGAA